MDNSFFIVPNSDGNGSIFKTSGFSDGLYRKELIDNICDNTEKRHYTMYPNVVKLCRICMRDVCKELTERINWETTLFKKYTNALESVSVPDELIGDLNENIQQCKCRYNEYHSLLIKFKKVKLCTDACIICKKS
jgi:ribosomal protein S14